MLPSAQVKITTYCSTLPSALPRQQTSLFNKLIFKPDKCSKYLKLLSNS
jgi:hypothetical protein